MSDSWDKNKTGQDEWSWDLPEGMDPMRVMQMASAYWDSCVIHAANRLDVFNLLDDQPKDLDTLTRETGADRRCLGALLSAVVSLDLLDRDGDTFMNNEFSKTFLTKSSKFYQGGICTKLFNSVEYF